MGFAAALAASALLIAGCAAGPGSDPSSTAEPPPVEQPDAEYELGAAWLDDGRMFAVVTWGSSTCVPVVETVEADGQRVTVTFAEDEEVRACTMDYVPRASVAGLPEGVDPTEDVHITLVDPIAPDATPSIELDGNDDLGGRGGQPTDYEPSAGWFGDNGVVLLTWGSSSCPPVIEDIASGDDGPVITIKDETGACTADMAPRLTIVGFDGSPDDDTVLTLNGGGFDGARVPVLEN